MEQRVHGEAKVGKIRRLQEEDLLQQEGERQAMRDESDAKQGKRSEKVGWSNADQAPRIKGAVCSGLAAKVQQDRCNQIAGECEEDVHSDPAELEQPAKQARERGVVNSENQKDRDGPKPIQLLDAFGQTGSRSRPQNRHGPGWEDHTSANLSLWPVETANILQRQH